MLDYEDKEVIERLIRRAIKTERRDLADKLEYSEAIYSNDYEGRFLWAETIEKLVKRLREED
jgi:hypothetical protein